MNSNNYSPFANNRQSGPQTSNYHQQNHIQTIPGSKFYTSASTNKNDYTKRKTKDRNEDEDSPAPDSTTEPPPRPVKQFQEGDDVFFHTDNGQHILGTVGQIQGQTCLILFGDGSQQWASFKRVKKLSCALNDEEEESGDREKSKTEQTTAPSIPTNQQTELTCVSCGAVRRVPSKKALTYSPHTSNQFSCRRCTNKSITGSSAINFNSVSIQGPFNSAGQKLLSRHTSGDLSVQSSSSALANSSRVLSKTACAMPMPSEQGPMNVCFHCEKRTVFNDRVHCNLCERACHLRCLALSPPPLEGDRFWDVMCSACGTQKGNEQSGGRLKVFSVRRNISSWSDVVHLILCCLGCKSSGQRYFDLETAIIPFFDVYLERLHLPRLYKAANPEDRKIHLLTALTNAKLRFVNGKEVKKKCSLWAVRSENFRGYHHMGMQPQMAASFPAAANSTIDRSSMGNAHIVPGSQSLSAATPRQLIFNREITLIPKPPPNSAPNVSPTSNVNQAKPPEMVGKRLEKDQRNKVDSVANFITSLSETTLKISKTNGLTVTPLPDKSGSNKGSASICDSNNKFSNDRTTISSTKSPSRSSSSGSLSEAESSSFDSDSTSASESSNDDSETSEVKTPPITTTAKKKSGNDGKLSGKRPVESPAERNRRPNLRVRPPNNSSSSKKTEGSGPAKKPKLDEPVVTSSPVVKDKQKILNSISQTTPMPIILSPISKSTHPVTSRTSNANSPRVAQKTSATSPLASERVRKKLSSEISDDDVTDRDEDKDVDITSPPSSGNSNTTQQTQSASKFPRAAKTQNQNGNSTSTSSNVSAAPPVSQQSSSSSLLQPPSPRVGKVASYTASGSQSKTSSPVVNDSSVLQKPNGRPGRPKAARNLQLALKGKEKAGAALDKAQIKEKRKILRAVKGRGRALLGPQVTNQNLRPNGLALANGFIDSLITTPSSYGYNELFLSGDEPSSNNIACTNLTVRDCAFFGNGYEITCLPPLPQTNQEKIEARNKVANYFLSELPPKAPAFWNSTNKLQTDKGRRLARDLNDYDSYDIVAKKVDSNGTVKYMVQWKTGFESESSSESVSEDEVKVNVANGQPVADYNSSILNDVKIKKENEKISTKVAEKATTTDTDVDKCRGSKEYFVSELGLRRTEHQQIPALIDLTDSS